MICWFPPALGLGYVHVSGPGAKVYPRWEQGLDVAAHNVHHTLNFHTGHPHNDQVGIAAVLGYWEQGLEIPAVPGC